jgi:iron complex outermembrane receptor protein
MGASLFGGAMLLPLQEASAQGAAAAILEEVVVTARRREESLEDLPLSVVAISADAMQAQGIYTTDQIGDFAANVSLSQSDRMNHSRIFIRGIGGGFPNPIAVFGTGMYIDGHYLPGSLANYMSTVDVERVEVLRGPQGTLFGKNVTGGAVNIISAKPGPEFESSLTVRAGQYGQQDVRGMLNIPISDELYFRGSISNEQLDGYWDNMFLGIDGTDWRDSTNFRGALRWLPNDNWSVDVTAQVGKDRNGQLGRQCQTRVRPDTIQNMLDNGYTQAEIDAVNPNIVANSPATSFNDAPAQWGGSGPTRPGGHIDRSGIQTASNGVTVNPNPQRSVLAMWDWCNQMSAAGDYTHASEKESFSNADNNAIFASAAWNSDGPVGGLDNLEIRTNFSWRNSRFNWIIDRDYTPLSVDNLGHVDEGDGTNSTTRNFEMIFDMEVNDRLNALVGVYIFDELTRTGDGNCYPQWEQMFETYDINTGQRPGDPAGLGIDVFGADTPCGPGSEPGAEHGGLVFEFLPDRLQPGGPGNAFQNVNLVNDSTAVFGHLTYALNDDWDLELGARWTEDDRFFNIIEFDTGTGSTLNSCNYLGNRLCQPTPILNYQNVVQEGFFNQERAVFDEVTPMVSLTRNLAPTDSMDSGMIYFLYSEGFLTGSFNDELNIFLTPQLQPLVTYQPETVTNYEVGFKGTFNGGRVRLNADIFFMDYQNKQEGIELDNFDGRFGPDPSIELTQNAGQVDIYGLELELRASPWDGGFLSVDASYLVNEYNSFIVDDVDNPGQTRDLSNSQIGDRSPDWTLNFNIGHTFQLNNGGSITAQTGFYAQGEYEWLAGGGQNPQLDDPASVCFQDSYANWRARATYEPAAGNWQASLFGSNITDERFLQECDYARTGVYDYRWAPPSAWGLEFVARWGE